MNLIKFDNVSFSYGLSPNACPAVSGVSFEVEKGQIVALLGRNGSGKSTVAKLCNGLIVPKSGSVTIDGFDTKDEKSIFEIRSRVGMVFQNPDNQTVATIVEDDVAFGPENIGLEQSKIRERVDEALSQVNMTEYAKRPSQALSGGQKQRVAIAGVLALRPSIMVLDESTSMLDPVSRKEVMDVVLDLVKKENITLLIITHFVEEALLADKVIVMSKGEIVMQGDKSILAKREEIESVGLVPPTAVYVRDALKQSGLDIGEVLTNEDLVREIKKCR